MAKGYRPVERDQLFLLPADMNEWVPPGHLSRFVVDVVRLMDTSMFHADRLTGGVGRAGFDPDMLVALLVYAYCHGVRSSRQIERLCEVDVAFMVICARDVPDHTTIARFRAGHDEAFVGLLVAVLRLAARAGLGRFGTVAIDGSKVAADASIDLNRDEDWLREQAARMVAEAAAVDAAEDAELGDVRGDELPPELADPNGRAAAIRAALAELDAHRRAAAEADQADTADISDRAAEKRRRLVAGERSGSGKVPDRDVVEFARLRLAQTEAAQQAKIDAYQARLEAARDRPGSPPTGRAPAPVDECFRVRQARTALQRAVQRLARREQRPQPIKPPLRVNLTDPQSRVMPTRHGWIQGYNVQLGVTADQLIVAAQVSQQPNDCHQLVPMMTAVTHTVQLFRSEGRGDVLVGTLLADAGYGTNANLAAAGPDRLIALGTGRDQHRAATRDPVTGPPPEQATLRQAMRHRLRTPEGAALYRRRGATVEPAIGNLKKIINRFSRRGLNAATAEINLAAAAFNLMKIYRAAPATS
jgi:transposase